MLKFYLILLICLGPCIADGTSKYYFPGREAIEPPEWYRESYKEVEDCLDMEGDFEGVRWYVSKDLYKAPWFGTGPKIPLAGMWEEGRKITLEEDWVTSETTVRHEIIHDILRQRGIGGHPFMPFEECELPPMKGL